MASTARISVMTTLFSFAAVDIVVPLLVIVGSIAVSEVLFAVTDLVTARRRAA